MNWANVAAVILFAGSLVLLRLVAARQISKGRGNYLWLAFLLPIGGFVVVVWAGLSMLGSDPLIGIFLAAIGAVSLIGLLLAIRRGTLSISGSATAEEGTWKLMEAFEPYYLLMALVVLFGGLLAVAALLIFFLSTR